MRIAVSGASGFVGRRVCAEARSRGHEVLALGRRSGDRIWDPAAGPAPLEGVDAVIHLAGEPIAEGRWTRSKMTRLRDSRIVGTRNLVAGIRQAKVGSLVSASAIGVYGDRGDEELSEDSPAGSGFLAELCRDWEREAAGSGVRTAIVRIGIVLGSGGGALSKMLTPFKLGLGGRLGSGRQWMSWIHLDDLAALLLHAVEQPSVSGPLLGTSPQPATNLEFTKTLGRVLGRWTIAPMPRWTLRLVVGRVADVLCSSQRCLPRRTLESGFAFRHEALEPALRSILG